MNAMKLMKQRYKCNVFLKCGYNVLSFHYQDPLLGGLLSIFPVNLHDNNFTVEHSGKLKVLDRMLHQLHSQQSRDRIVLVSNYTKVVCTSVCIIRIYCIQMYFLGLRYMIMNILLLFSLRR